jgi:hypothetical protein
LSDSEGFAHLPQIASHFCSAEGIFVQQVNPAVLASH